MFRGSGTEDCLMNEARDAANGIVRFSIESLIGPNAACPTNQEPALRTHSDPVP